MVDIRSLSARNARQGSPSGGLTAEALVTAYLDRIAAREPVVGAWQYLDREQALAAARRRDAEAAARAAARHPDRGQGPDRHRRHADRLRLADLSRPPAGGRRRLRRAGARRRRGRPRQDRDDRVRQLHAGQDRQPAQPGAHAGRLVERLGRGGGRRHGAARLRHADRRLGDPARRLLRLRRLQAELRPDQPRRGQAAVPTASTRSACLPASSRTRRSSPACSPGGRRCATSRVPQQAAAFRPLPHADVGRGRAGDGGCSRRGAGGARTRRRRRSTELPIAPEHQGLDRGAGHDHVVRDWCAASPMSGSSTAPSCRRAWRS